MGEEKNKGRRKGESRIGGSSNLEDSRSLGQVRVICVLHMY